MSTPTMFFLLAFLPLATAHLYYQTDYYYYYPTSYYYSTALQCYGTMYYTWSNTLYATTSYLPCPPQACYYSMTRNVCCMTNFVGADGTTVQQCRCSSSVTCGSQPLINPTVAPTTATTATTATTTTSTTTTTPTTTTTTPTTTTTTTTTPTTTTTTPTTTTTTTTTTTPTTTVPPSLCQSGFRLLNGVPVSNDCIYGGIANVTTKNGTVVSCNAVLATATVNGILKKTFVTTSICGQLIAGGTFEISIGNQNYPITAPIFTVVNGTNGIAYITINDRYINLLSYLGTCQTTACAYNPATMAGKLDFNDCKVVSWGSSQAGKLVASGLYEAAIRFSPLGCTNIPNLFGANTNLCFATVSGQNLYCSGDNGAPVYCKAPSNGEWILLGSVAMQLVCNGSSEIKVIPFPG